MTSVAMQMAELQAVSQLHDVQRKIDNVMVRQTQLAHQLNSDLLLPVDEVIINGQVRHHYRANWAKYHGLEMILENQLQYLVAIRAVLKETLDKIHRRKEQDRVRQKQSIYNGGIYA